jgi:hypothetical protein
MPVAGVRELVRDAGQRGCRAIIAAAGGFGTSREDLRTYLMLISKLIAELQAIQAEHGDLPVASDDDNADDRFSEKVFYCGGWRAGGVMPYVLISRGGKKVGT